MRCSVVLVAGTVLVALGLACGGGRPTPPPVAEPDVAPAPVAAAPAPAPAKPSTLPDDHAPPDIRAPVPIAASPPSGMKLDGRVDEWSDLPTSIVLTRMYQVAGKQPVKDSADFSAEIWLSLSKQGLTMAGRIHDDKVLLPNAGSSAKERIRSDHLELWLSLSEPPMPVLGFANQFGEEEVKGPEYCDSNYEGASESIASCKKWLADQIKRRKTYEAWFRKQFLIDPEGLREVVNGQVGDVIAKSEVHFERSAGGYDFEGFLPLSVLPATTQVPIQKVSLLVEAVDNDAGQTTQESFLSSATERNVSVPKTWNRGQLEAPIDVHHPTGLPAKIAGNPEGWFYFPSDPIQKMHRFENVPIGYQYEPEEESPSHFEMELPTAQYFRAGQARVWYLEDGADSFIATTEHAKSTGFRHAPCPQKPERVTRGGRTHMIWRCEGFNSRLGTGICGACPASWYEVVAVKEDGTLETLAEAFISSSPSGAEIEWAEAADNSAYAFRCETEEGKTTTWSLAWDDAKKTYVQDGPLPSNLGSWHAPR